MKKILLFRIDDDTKQQGGFFKADSGAQTHYL
jgi:hypothetical protein